MRTLAKVTSNGNVKVRWYLSADITNPDSPSLTQLNNNGVELSSAIAWDGYEVGASDSDDVDDRALTDIGNAVTRGFANYAATLPFFYDADYADTSSVYNDAFDAFRVPLTEGWLVTRVAKDATLPFAAGDRVSVFKFQTGAVTNDTEGDDSYKFVVEFLPQGALYVNTLAETSAAVIALPATATVAVGAYQAITATTGGVNITHSAIYSSSDTTKATVSELGIVKGIAAGSATITVSHPSSNASDTVAITVT